MDFFGQLLNALPGAISQGLIWGIMAIGVFITYKILDVSDLTVDGSFATGGVVAVILILNGCNLWFAMIVAFIAGMIAGLITGLLHTLMGIPAILAGILSQLALYSINLKMLGKANVALNVNQTDLLISLRWVKELAFHNPLITVTVVVALLIAALYWFFGREIGCGIRATGANIKMARAQGINTSFNTVLGIMLSNGLVALSGAFLTQYQGFADIKMGQGAIVIGLAAVVIGKAVFGKIFKNFALRLLSVVLGAVIYYLVVQTVITLGFDANLLKLLSATIVAIFLAVPYWKKKYSSTHVSKKGGKQNA